MGTTRVTRTYANSEFTAASNPNARIFTREIGELPLSVQPTNIHPAGTDIIVRWDDELPLASDIDLIDGYVPIHTGGVLTAQSIRLESEGIDTNSTDIWENKLSLSTSMVAAGTYEVVWYAEIASDAVVSNSSAAVRIIINGIEEFFDRQPNPPWFPVSGTNFVDVLDGDIITIDIDYRKAGPAANMAKIQKARASIKPLNS
jgi:hypothetical protein